jgi:hypothetical protein
MAAESVLVVEVSELIDEAQLALGESARESGQKKPSKQT